MVQCLRLWLPLETDRPIWDMMTTRFNGLVKARIILSAWMPIMLHHLKKKGVRISPRKKPGCFSEWMERTGRRLRGGEAKSWLDPARLGSQGRVARPGQRRSKSASKESGKRFKPVKLWTLQLKHEAQIEERSFLCSFSKIYGTCRPRDPWFRAIFKISVFIINKLIR